MSQRLASFEDLVGFLTKSSIPHRVDAADRAVEVTTTPPALAAPVIVRWEQSIPYIQIIQQLTNQVPDDRVRDLEAALARVNDTAMIAGYEFSYKTRVVYYRLTIPIYDGGISSVALDDAMTAVLNNAVQLEPAIAKVIAGTPGESVLELLARPKPQAVT
jgi:hypothetical protein